MLRLLACSKTIHNQSILQNISLSLKGKTILGLAGPSGSGKSTLLRCIQGLDQFDDGEVFVEQPTAFVFQEFHLFPHMNVINNLTYAPKVIDRNSQHHDDRAKALLHTLGIADKAASFPHQLSGGQKQRVALARSLMINPSLLLCDEPTSALDSGSIEEITSLFLALRELGVALIVASHDLPWLVKIADRVVIMKQGAIVTDMELSTLEEPLLQLASY